MSTGDPDFCFDHKRRVVDCAGLHARLSQTRYDAWEAIYNMGCDYDNGHIGVSILSDKTCNYCADGANKLVDALVEAVRQDERER